MDQYDLFKSAIDSANSQSAPTADPELAQLYGSSFRSSAAELPSEGFYDATGAAAASAGRGGGGGGGGSGKIKAEYRPNAAGGYDFFGDDGAQVSPFEYARLTGKDLDSILGDSLNPRDLQFTADYQKLRALLEAVYTGDAETLGQFGEEVSNGTPDDLVNRFKTYYADYFQMGGQPTKEPGSYSAFRMANQPRANQLRVINADQSPESMSSWVPMGGGGGAGNFLQGGGGQDMQQVVNSGSSRLRIGS